MKEMIVITKVGLEKSKIEITGDAGWKTKIVLATVWCTIFFPGEITPKKDITLIMALLCAKLIIQEKKLMSKNLYHSSKVWWRLSNLLKVLITGIAGFVGSHLAEYCLSKPNVKLYGIFLHKEEIKNIKHIKEKITLLKCDLTKKRQVRRAILTVRPDKVFHLAGQSHVFFSWSSPEKTLLNNITSDLNLFEAVKNAKISPVIVLAGSSEEYGLTLKNELPIKENNPLRPLSPYAVSKIAQEKLGFQYHKSYGLKIVLTRFFNTEGPRRGEHFATSSFARQIANIEKRKQKPVIFAGNLEAKRDFTDVRDVAKAYWLASKKCEFGEPYNVCSGKARSIKSVLDLLVSKSSVKNIKIQQDPTRMRPSDIPVIVGDNTKFKKQTGWAPEIPFEKTMEDLLNYWREIK